MKCHRLWLGVVLLLSLTACNPFSYFGSKPVPDYKQNRNPKQRYDITMTIANAPGVFASMEAWMLYSVANQECLPAPNSNPQGTSNHMTRPVPFALVKVSDTEYTGTVYMDFLLDEDYHGRGICHWQLLNIGIDLKATGVEGETSFLPGLSGDDLIAGKAVTTYFLKKSYPRHPESVGENPVASGQSDRSKMAFDTKDNDLFAITLVPKEVQP